VFAQYSPTLGASNDMISEFTKSALDAINELEKDIANKTLKYNHSTIIKKYTGRYHIHISQAILSIICNFLTEFLDIYKNALKRRKAIDKGAIELLDMVSKYSLPLSVSDKMLSEFFRRALTAISTVKEEIVKDTTNGNFLENQEQYTGSFHMSIAPAVAGIVSELLDNQKDKR
jgi:hypothetical protein